MPKQIIVANKSRKQTIKVNFRQSPFLGRDNPPKISGLADMDQSVVRQVEFTESVKCMTFPGQFLRLTYSSSRKNSRTRIMKT